MERLETITENGDLNKLLVYQPGNGTRYEVVVADLVDQLMFGWFSAAGGRASALFRKNEKPMSWDYFCEKMNLCQQRADAVALIVLFGELTGRAVQIPGEFDRAGNYRGKTGNEGYRWVEFEEAA